jgi:hypothetical protein
VPDKLVKHGRMAHSGCYDYARREIPRLGLDWPPPSSIGIKAMYSIYRPAQVLVEAVKDGLFTNMTLTRGHPEEWVDPDNFKEHAIGFTGELPEIEYMKDKKEVSINGTLTLVDSVALESYEKGIVDLSPGYLADFVWRKGVDPNGKPYDAVMTKVNGTNHLAMVNKGRGGAASAIMDKAASGFKKIASGLWWAVKRRTYVRDGDGSGSASSFTGFRSSLTQCLEGRASLSDEEIREDRKSVV